jgi:uncharacterized protein YhaN
VKLTDIRVDGFGVLSDLHITDLPPGLSVLIGPNEAGKSTLLDFIRGVLFGFPSKRSAAPQHVPLRSAKHGGSLGLRDETGRILRLERHVGAKTAQITDQLGRTLGDNELARMLNGADDALFKAVFAFGLSELSDFQTLDRDQVQEVVFSAGVLGAGRSATQAIQSLEARRQSIVRPRQQDAKANQLRKAMEERELALREARGRARSFAAEQARVASLRKELASAREQGAVANKRLGELARLRAAWPVVEERENAARRLGSLAPLDAGMQALLGNEIEIASLASELSGHYERAQQLDLLESNLRTVKNEFAREIGELGAEVEPDQMVPLSAEHEARAVELIDAYRQRRVELEAKRDEADRLTAECRAQASELERLEDGSVRSNAALDALEDDIRALRAHLIRRDQLEAERRAERAQRELAHKSAPSHIPHNMMIAMLLAMSGLALALFGASSHAYPTMAGGAALLVGGFVVLQRRSVKNGPDPIADSSLDSDLAQLVSEIATTGERLSLGASPMPGHLEVLAHGLERERSRRREIDNVERGLHDLERRAREASSREERARASLDEATTTLRELRTKLGLPSEIDIADLGSFIATLRRAQKHAQAIARMQAQIGVLKGVLTRFEDRVKSLCEIVSLDTGANDVGHAVALLSAALDAAREQLAERQSLEQAIEHAEMQLMTSFGNGEEALQLRRELMDGNLIDWEQESALLKAQIADRELSTEQLIAELSTAERTLTELQDSSDVARIELELEQLRAQLTKALEEWALLGTAKALLGRTLGHYERERQPEVIARASELFSKVTEGRYVQLVARENLDGTRRHGIEAITPSGTRVDSGDLSRGTAEQLYLCLRLAFATTYASRSISLPLVLDDVLVNFDPSRAQAIAEAIAITAQDHQVLAFTCHPHILECFKTAEANAHVVRLERCAGL